MTARGWALGALLDGHVQVADGGETTVGGLCIDSRACAPGDLFLAQAGYRVHGLVHAAAAVHAGAVAVVYDPAGVPQEVDAGSLGVPTVALPRLGQIAGLIADRFYDSPSRTLDVIGVTGTNGKTSCCHFLAQVLDMPGARCGVLGTVGNGLAGELAPVARTTPDAVSLHAELARLRDAGARRAVVEVSSHGLVQGRLAGVMVRTAIFTNLSHEHLDYHGDMASYAAAKRRLFDQPGLRHAVLNVDDPVSHGWLGSLRDVVDTLGYGFSAEADVRGSELELGPEGLAMRITTPFGSGYLACGLLGHFNASNLLAVLAALLAEGVALDAALQRLAGVHTVPGRMERFGGGERPLVIVDYAHTPDALVSALKALRDHCRGRLWCVFGCGGERDAAKRPLMGAAAERYADHVIVTDDNPRHEDGGTIIEHILAGMATPDATEVERDRAAAIRRALEAARPGDMVLVAGKGHETVQVVGDDERTHSDRDLVIAWQEAGQ